MEHLKGLQPSQQVKGQRIPSSPPVPSPSPRSVPRPLSACKPGKRAEPGESASAPQQVFVGSGRN